MAVYLTNQLKLSKVQILDIKFHKKLNYLAISVIKESTLGNILIADNNGHIYDDCKVSNTIPTSCILWHPTKPFLAVGWTDGGLTIYDSSKNIRFDSPPIHVLPIASFSWSSHGSKLVSADIEGNLHSWKIDFNGGFGQAPIFSYNAGCAINCIVLRMTKMSGNDVYDIRELARAAVSGDERALDLMSWSSKSQKSGQSNIKFTGYSYVEVATFLAGLADGRIVLINENGKVFNITSLEGSVVRMLYHEERDIFIATTDVGMLTHHELLADGTSSREVMKVKLACRTPNPSMIWAGGTTLAICLGESMLRMWDIDREENYTLNTRSNGGSMSYLENTQITMVDYNAAQKSLVAGTSKGQIIQWKLIEEYKSNKTLASLRVTQTQGDFDLEEQWCLQPATTLYIDDSNTVSAGSIEKVVASSSNIVAVATSTNVVFLLEEISLQSAFSNGIIVQQISSKEFIIQLYDVEDSSSNKDIGNLNAFKDVNLDPELNGLELAKPQVPKVVGNKFYTIAVEHPIRRITCTNEVIIISDGNLIYSYNLDFNSSDIVKICGQFECSSTILKVHQQNVFVFEKNDLQIRNFQGTVKQLVDISGMDGVIQHVEINNNFLVCCTDKCSVRVFDLSRRDPKPVSPVNNLGDSIPSITRINSISVNCTGQAVSFLMRVGQNHFCEPKLLIWMIEYDTLHYFNFRTGRSDLDDPIGLPSSHGGAGEIPRRKKSAGRGKLKSGRRSARSRNRKRRQQEDMMGLSVTESILYDDDEEDEEDNEEPDADSGVDDSPRDAYGSTTDDVDPLLGYPLTVSAGLDLVRSQPVSHHWDRSDPRIVIVEIVPGDLFNRDCSNLGANAMRSPAQILADYPRNEAKLVSLFATQDDGIMVFDSFPFTRYLSKLVGFETPYFYFSTRIDQGYEKRNNDGSVNSFIEKKIMRDFQGLESNQEGINRKAILNFSYYLTMGNMDEAFKSMKLIKSQQVWKNMARMCVKTRRLDVAAICLGKMGQARAAMHLRQAHHSVNQIDAKIAILALQLGMKDEAIQLLERTQRYDILNELYQAMAEWDKAIDIAEKHDRIHLKTTYYNYAKYLEVEKRYSEAIENFVKSGTHAFEVPRMLFDQPDDLEKFIKERPEKSLKKWWAQYMECCGHMKLALEFYAAAQDYFSLVRAYWLLGMEQKAKELCDDTGDSAACYHIARQFEAAEDIDQAIHYFSRARAYNSAIRLCQEHNKDDHLVNLALCGTAEDQIAAANYLQTRGPAYADKAVMLLHRGGQISRAIDLAVRTQQFSALAKLGGPEMGGDPALVQQCAAFFMQHRQFDRAVDLLANNNQLWDALKLCVEYNVPMTEGLAEKLTPPKSAEPGLASSISGDTEFTEAERSRYLEGVAEVALSQRQYHLACKKFTQAGNQLMAMKSLLKSGDTNKIVFFANVAKTRDVYVLAANYLQTVDWRSDPEITKHISQFYTRGKAIDRLAGFYESCALSEIEEFQNYQKALNAYGEAHKYWSKVKFDSESDKVDKLEQIVDKCALIKKFIVATSALANNTEDSLQQCQMLLDDHNLQRAVRYGDVYAAMVKFFMSQSKYKAAYSCLEEMKSRISNPSVVIGYLDVKTLETLHKALNLPFRAPSSLGKQDFNKTTSPDDNHEEEDDIIDDEIAAAIDEDLN